MRKLLAALSLILAAEPCVGARTFVSASTYLEYTTPAITAAPFSMACWFKATTTAANHTLISISDVAGTNDNIRLSANGGVAGDPVSMMSRRASEAAANTSTGFSAGVWHHACGVTSASDSRAAFIDGGSKGTDATSNIPINLDNTTVGAWKRPTVVNPCDDCDLAEVAIWDVALSDDDCYALSRGVRPTFVKPSGLVVYIPLIGNTSPEVELVSGATFTVTGSPAVAAHPRIRYSYANKSEWFASAAAPAAGQPTMRRWESVPFMPSGRGRGGIRMLTDTVPSLEEIPCVGCSR